MLETLNFVRELLAGFINFTGHFFKLFFQILTGETLNSIESYNKICLGCWS